MNLTDHIQKINEYINLSHMDSNIELEVLLKESINNKINKDSFINIIRKIKGIPGIEILPVEESLDIRFEYEPGRMSPTRVQIKNQSSVRKYCSTNQLKDVNYKNIIFMNKYPVYVDEEGELIKFFRGQDDKVKLIPIDIPDYKIRFNLKKEIFIKNDSPKVKEIYRNWLNKQKEFRYKQRHSFITKDKNFRFDLTIVKTSTLVEELGDNREVKLSSVPEHQRKERFIIKPDEHIEISFDEWISTLSETDLVLKKGHKYEKYLKTKTLQESKTLINNPRYEVEIEYIGNTKSTHLDTDSVLSHFIKNIGVLLQAIQKSYYLISETEKNNVRLELKRLLNSYTFLGPHNVSLELKHILYRNYSDHKFNIINIRKGYTVTEKADGERNIMVVNTDGKLYMINRKNNIRYLGASLPDYAGTIIDGEYITKDKHNRNINMYLAFDIYYFKNTDLRTRHLYRSKSERIGSGKQKSRLEFLEDIFAALNLVKDEDNTLEIFQKSFYFGDDFTYDKTTEDAINLLTSEKMKEVVDSSMYNDIQSRIDDIYQTNKIFNEVKSVYSKEYVYKIDGLIFTPINLAVGEDPQTGKINFNGRWFSSLKWKPPEENTIDFSVKFQKEGLSNSIKYIESNGRKLTYQIVHLKIGYNPRKHTKYNSCRILNENLMYNIVGDDYESIPFQPTKPFVKDVHICYLPVKSGVIKCLDNSIINDNSIVEFSYNPKSDVYTRWTPLRVRDVNKSNDFLTSTNVWNSIHEPISIEMITEEEPIKSDALIEFDDTYYRGEKNRTKYLTKPMNDFHSWIKKGNILNNTKRNNVILDLGCGKVGDLKHWIDAKLSHIVGIDYSKDNLENINNGACNRILDTMSKDTNPILNNIMLVWADCGKNIIDGSAGFDDLNQYYLNIIWGNISNKTIQSSSKLNNFYDLGNIDKGYGFDSASCNFAIHYFFQSVEILDTFLNNVSKSLKTGGKFFGCCLDGSLVFDKLSTNSIVEGKMKETLWRITKKYNTDTFNNDETSLGLPIDIYYETINQTITEWLVNFKYLEMKAIQHNLKLLEYKGFDELWSEFNSEKITYGDANKLTEIHQEFSFMNKIFIFQKD